MTTTTTTSPTPLFAGRAGAPVAAPVATDTVTEAYEALGVALGYTPAGRPARAADAGAPAWEQQAAALEVAAALIRHLGELPAKASVHVYIGGGEQIGLILPASEDGDALDAAAAIAAAIGARLYHARGTDNPGQLYFYLGQPDDGRAEVSWRGVAVDVSLVFREPAIIARALAETPERPGRAARPAAR